MAGERAAMNEADLVRRAGELGVAVSYLDWRDRRVQVPGETLRAIVAALDGAADSVPAGAVPVPAGAVPVPAGAVPGPAGAVPGPAGAVPVPADPRTGVADARPIRPAAR
ncbi:MAG: hypothetical protein ACYCVZ_18800, partial [Streptosporangiaceae bacterium]